MKNTALDLREIRLRIAKKEYLSDALKRHGFVALPFNAIINKRLPGLGATYCELTAPRHSINKCFVFDAKNRYVCIWLKRCTLAL